MKIDADKTDEGQKTTLIIIDGSNNASIERITEGYPAPVIPDAPSELLKHESDFIQLNPSALSIEKLNSKLNKCVQALQSVGVLTKEAADNILKD